MSNPAWQGQQLCLESTSRPSIYCNFSASEMCAHIAIGCHNHANITRENTQACSNDKACHAQKTVSIVFFCSVDVRYQAVHVCQLDKLRTFLCYRMACDAEHKNEDARQTKQATNNAAQAVTTLLNELNGGVAGTTNSCMDKAHR